MGAHLTYAYVTHSNTPGTIGCVMFVASLMAVSRRVYRQI